MFQLAMPWVLTLLILPLLIWFYVKKAPLRLSTALKLPFLNELAPIIREQQAGFVRQKSLMLFSIIWILLVLAAANPQWIGQPIPFQREGCNILMVLDLSGSMDLEDMVQNGRSATRLSLVKSAAKQFVAARTTDKIGLVLFGSQAYLQTPLTYDHQNVLTRIDDAEAGLAGNTTSIGDALGLAIKHLQTVSQKSRVVILLTDGASNSGVLTPLKAAELAEMEGIKIYTIGLGADALSQNSGNFFLDAQMGQDLDETTLQQIAKQTGGQYFRATDAKSLQSIYKTIDTLEKVNQEGPIIRPQKNYYPWPLSLALVLLFTWFFKHFTRGPTNVS